MRVIYQRRRDMKFVKRCKDATEATKIGLRFIRSYYDTYGAEEYAAVYWNGGLRRILLLLARACGEGRVTIPDALLVMHIIYEPDQEL
jgi:hypothetical protein